MVDQVQGEAQPSPNTGAEPPAADAGAVNVEGTPPPAVLPGASDDFTGIFTAGDEDATLLSQPEEEQQVPVQPPAPASPQAAPPVAPTPPPVPPTQQQAAPQPPAPVQGDQTASQAMQAPQSLGDLLTVLRSRENDIVKALSSSEFALSQQERDALETDYAAAVPDLLAKTYTKAIAGAVHYMNQHLPRIIEDTVSRTAAVQQAENEFFRQFPQLNRNDHGQDITSVGLLLRQQSPQMPVPELLTKIGQIVTGMRGLPMQAVAPVPAAPAAQRAAPFAPALSSARTMQQGPAVTQGNDFFGGLSQDYDT